MKGISERIGWGGVVAGGVLALLFLVAIFAPLLAPHDPNQVSLGEAYASSSSQHWLGTDATGRDILSRLIVGSRTALLGPLLVVVFATLIGTAIAIFAAWRGGLTDTVAVRILDILFAFPAILLAILSAAVFGAGLTAVVLAIGIAYIPYVARVIRSEAVRQRALPYITACEAQGQSALRVCSRHLLPNLLPLIIAQMTVSFGYAMIDLSAVSYLGFGVQPPTADWGEMVANGQPGILLGHPTEALAASALIVVAVLCFTVLGQRLGAPKERRL
ncbi:MAG: ABC transporter permease [Actinobacteria bacterium]|nr:ABC transporter permease [Actinomycetota bacterium]